MKFAEGDLVIGLFEGYAPKDEVIGTIKLNEGKSKGRWPYRVMAEDGSGSLYAESEVRAAPEEVVVLPAAELELARLQKIEAGLRGYTVRHTELAERLGGMAVICRSNKNYEDAKKLSKDADDIMYKVRRLEAILNGAE